MREIKFRAFWKDTREPVEDFMQEYSLDVLDGKEDNPFLYSQWTGLKDKNGKEIYEGDILIAEDMDELTVFWNEKMAGFGVEDSIGKFPLGELDFRYWSVIGNIYEEKP